MKRIQWKNVIAILLAAVILAACGGGPEEPTPTPTAAVSAQEVIAQTLEVVMHDIYYGESPDNIQNPPTWTVKSGEQIQINMDNQGGLQHNWAVVKQGVEVPVPFDSSTSGDSLLFKAGAVEPGQQGSATFTAPDAGVYAVICTVAGHYPAMQGKLVVE